VGIRGVRIQAIVRELHDEKIDVIEWNPDPALYIAKALSPARVHGVYLNEKNSGGKTATVVVPEDQLSLAIGRDGQNARLAAKLTSWRIDIKSLPEAAADVVHRLQTDAVLAPIAESEATLLEQVQGMLARKADNRALAPEEYERMAQFVDRVEKRAQVKRQPEKKVEDRQRIEARKLIVEAAFEKNLLESLSEHVAYTLQENGYTSVGELAVQMKVDPDEILKLQGMGPRAMTEINRLVDSVTLTGLETPEAAQPTAELQQTPQASAEIPVSEPVAIEDQPEPVVQAEFISDTVLKPIEPVVTAEAPESTPEAALPELEEEGSFDQLFTLRPEVITDGVASEEEEDDSTGDKGKKGKKGKKKKHVEIEFDPDAGRTFVTKKHKRGEEGWEW
jgi:N utilization substance protein A